MAVECRIKTESEGIGVSTAAGKTTCIKLVLKLSYKYFKMFHNTFTFRQDEPRASTTDQESSRLVKLVL